MRASSAQLIATLRESGRGLTAARSKLNAGRLFAGAQVALSLLLVVAAGLFLRTLVNLENVDLGYHKDKLIVMSVDAASTSIPGQQLDLFFSNMQERLRSLPGVKSVTFSHNGLFSGSESGTTVLVEGYVRTGKTDNGTAFDQVGPEYFSALGIPLQQGRDFDLRDLQGSHLVCVVNNTFNQKFFSGRGAIGKHVTFEFGDKKTTFEVVGVSRDSRDHSLRDKLDPRVYISQDPESDNRRSAYFEVRVTADQGSILPQLKSAVLALNPDLEVESRFLARSLDDQLSQERLIANLVALFGILALAIAAIGIYGVLAYGVSQRTSEIGVRIAIGAATRDVVNMIARETLWMISMGLLVGVVCAFFLTRVVQSKLFGVSAADPAVLCGSVSLLIVVGLVAALVPALRASRIDPAIALRED